MTLSLTELQALTDYYWFRSPVDIYFKSNIILYKCLGGQTGTKLIDGGLEIHVPLEYAAQNAGPYGAISTLPTNKVVVFNAARFPWAAYYGQLTYDLDDARQNSGEAQIVDLIASKLRNTQKSIRSNMGTQIYSARSSNTGPLGETDVGFVGFDDLFNTTTSIAYGNIAEDDMADWAANVTTTSEAISFKVLQAMRRSASIDDNNEGKPDLYVTTDTLKDGYERTLQTQARYSSHELANAGFDNLLFGGKPMVVDNKVSSGICYGFNMRFLNIHTHRKFNFTQPTWNSPINQPDVKVAFIRWSGQLVCNNRKAHVKHTNLSEPS